MLRSIAFVAFCAFAAPSACAHQPPAPAGTPVRILCTVAKPWTPERCWVEFDGANTGPKVETASRSEAEELVAILLSRPGAVYVFDDGLQAARRSGNKARERLAAERGR